MKDLFAATAVTVALVTFPASAQEEPAGTLQPFEAALDRTVADDRDGDWRFTLTFTGEAGELVARFDGTRPEAERWTLVSPAEAELTDDQRDIWDDVITSDDEDDEEGGLFFSRDDALYRPGTLDLHLQDADDVTYRFRPVLDAEDEEEEAFAEHLVGEITVGRQEPGVRHVRLWAPDSFKPNFAVRVNRFELMQEYAEMDGMPAPVLVRMSQDISGRAAFQSFEQSFRIDFSDIEYLGEEAR